MFEKDVELMFKNCYLFNPSGNSFTNAVKSSRQSTKTFWCLKLETETTLNWMPSAIRNKTNAEVNRNDAQADGRAHTIVAQHANNYCKPGR